MEQAVRRLLAGLFVSGLETLCKERRRGLKPSSDVSVSDSQAVGGGEGNGAEDVDRNVAECLSPQSLACWSHRRGGGGGPPEKPI